jgi:hypothetical protein
MSDDRPAVNVQLGAAQWEVHQGQSRHKVVVAGRRWGKSVYAGVDLLEAGLQHIQERQPDHYQGYWVFPTYRQGKRVAWRFLKDLTRPWTTHCNETELSVDLMDRGTICIAGADKPDSLRGPGIHKLAMDEYADMKPDAWFEVLRPALADKEGSATFLGTPKGWNHFKDLYDLALEDTTGTWQAFSYTTLQGGRVTAQEIEDAKKDMDDRTYRQEFMATFETVAGRVYYNFDRRESVRDDLVDTGGDLHIGMDFNVNPMTALIWVKAGNQVHFIDEVVIPNSNTLEMAREIKRRYNRLKGVPTLVGQSLQREVVYMDVPRKMIVHPDPSGKSRKTSAPVGQTDFTILEDEGFEVRARRAASGVSDRVNNVNAMLKNADGDRRAFFHPRCKVAIRAFDGLIYKKGTSKPDDKQTAVVPSLGEVEIIHITDAGGYSIDYEYPITKTGLLRVKRIRV